MRFTCAPLNRTMLIFNKRDERYIIYSCLSSPWLQWVCEVLGYCGIVLVVCVSMYVHMCTTSLCDALGMCVYVGVCFTNGMCTSPYAALVPKQLYCPSGSQLVLNVCTLNSKAFRNVWITIHSSSYSTSVPSWIRSCQKWSMYCSFHWITLLCFLCLVQNSSFSEEGGKTLLTILPLGRMTAE